MRVCLMVEGQEDVTWPQWLALAEACESHGLEGLFRSDHYLSVVGRHERGSLDAWTTLAALAASTSRIRLGTLVSPASFRHPSVLAKSAVTVDHVSGGRVEVGLGAGWLEAEHRAYGFPFHPTPVRMQVLAEQLEIIRREWDDRAFSFDGEHYRLENLNALPKPVQQPHPPLIVGGSGGPRSLELATRWATEYNTVFATPDRCGELRQRLDEVCERGGRSPLPLSLMTGLIIGADRSDFERRAARLADLRGTSADEPLPDAWVAGTVEEVVQQLRQLEAAGVERVMLQHLIHTDLEAVALLGDEVAPAVA